jgi:hypothetical protein
LSENPHLSTKPGQVHNNLRAYERGEYYETYSEALPVGSRPRFEARSVKAASGTSNNFAARLKLGAEFCRVASYVIERARVAVAFFCCLSFD